MQQHSGLKNERSSKSVIKRPSSTLTPIMDVKVDPLYALPDHLMDPSVCKRFRQKLDSSTIRKERDEKFYENSYTGKRLRKERFRRHMVGLTIKPELPEEGFDINNDRDINRYYYYIRNGIDTIHVTSIDDQTIAKIIQLIPEKWHRRFKELAELLITEIRNDFIFGIKKSIVEFVLTDPFQDKNLANVRISWITYLVLCIFILRGFEKIIVNNFFRKFF